ncbi:MAG: integrase core domain-containing protein [Cognatishimia activa]
MKTLIGYAAGLVIQRRLGSITAQNSPHRTSIFGPTKLDFSRPGRPTVTGVIEAFNCKLRSECLNVLWFRSLADAGKKLENWRRHYSNDRPHCEIGYNAPNALHFPG